MRRFTTVSQYLNILGRARRADATERRPNGLRRVAWGFLLGLVFAAAPAFAASFTASLDREMISLGETATLSLAFEDVSPDSVPSPPAISNLQINYVGPSSQHSIINGQVSSSVRYVFSVTPRQAGDYKIPAITANVGGQRMSSQPLSLKVLKPNAPSPEAINSGAQPVFLKLTLPKKDVYIGEVITAELQFYFRQGVQLADQPHLTATPTEGFTLGKIAAGQQRQVQVGNAIYTLLPATVVLKAIKTGPVTVGPITAAVIVQSPSQNRRRGSFFEQFGFEDPFNAGERKQLSIATETLTAQSLPLPDNAPTDFDGAVGNYTMTATAGPTNVVAGDPITVRVQITGRGSLDALNLPAQAAWKNFKSYPPTSKIETTDQFGLQGTKTFEQVITPESPDIKELPAFTFSFFDPDAKQYRSLTQPAVALTVRPGGLAPAPVVAASSKFATADAPPPRQDIVHIKPRPGTLARIAPPLIQQPWFLAVQSVPVLAWLAAVGWRKRADSLANNPRLRRQRQVAQIIRAGLLELRRHATANQSEEFFATLFRLLQEQLGERLDCPASAITEAVLEEKLRPRGVDEGTLGRLHELFQTCNLARYAPITSGQELAALIPKLESALREVQEVKL